MTSGIAFLTFDSNFHGSSESTAIYHIHEVSDLKQIQELFRHPPAFSSTIMPMSADFRNRLDEYQMEYPDESILVERFRSLLKLPDAFYRTCKPGHFTASALILNKGMTQVLLVEHRKLGFWVQPGGHADGDVYLEKVARREVEEETGLSEFQGSGSILDLDIHPIPARKEEGAHDHYDVRYLFFANPEQTLVISEESTDLRWIDITDLENFTNEESMLRMLQKAGTRI